MSVVTTQKYHLHQAKQFVESLTEGSRTYGANLISAAANSTTLTISGNVFNVMRVGDILMVNAQSRLITDVALNGTSIQVNTAFSTAIAPQTFATRESIAAYDTYYVFVGRSTPWPSNDTTTAPVDSVITSSFDYLRDALILQRITADNLVYVVPRVDWTVGGVYTMYDHREDLSVLAANTDYPFYVRTDDDDVFKCLFNGRTSDDDSSIAESLSKPLLSGSPSPGAVITSAGSDGTFYRWKYLYSLTSSQKQKYLTSQYMPVFDMSDTLDLAGGGDVLQDSSAMSKAFDSVRQTGNGAIYEIVVENGGAGYAPALTTVSIIGDGSGAIARPVLQQNVVTQINMVAYGSNYTWATVTINNGGGVGSDATATAIISPRNAFTNTSGVFYVSNHGISNKDELLATRLMLYAELAGNVGGLLTTENEYRRIGILKNPTLVQSNETATGATYDMTTRLTITTGGNFKKDEVVFQESTGAYGVVVDTNTDGTTLRLTHVSATPFVVSSTTAGSTLIGLGNGNTAQIRTATNNVVPGALPEAFSPVVTPSGTTAAITAVQSPVITPYSGDILYVNHRAPILRTPSQTEVLRTILTF